MIVITWLATASITRLFAVDKIRHLGTDGLEVAQHFLMDGSGSARASEYLVNNLARKD